MLPVAYYHGDEDWTFSDTLIPFVPFPLLPPVEFFLNFWLKQVTVYIIMAMQTFTAELDCASQPHFFLIQQLCKCGYISKDTLSCK